MTVRYVAQPWLLVMQHASAEFDGVYEVFVGACVPLLMLPSALCSTVVVGASTNVHGATVLPPLYLIAVAATGTVSSM